MEALGGSQVAMTSLIGAASALEAPTRGQTNPTAKTRQTTPANKNNFCLFLMFPPPFLGCGLVVEFDNYDHSFSFSWKTGLISCPSC
jgi:hypothetical protein